MKVPTLLNPGDPCPNCGGAIMAVPVPTDDQRARAAHADDPVFLPPSMDTASIAQRAELGALYRCVNRDYQTRFPLEAAAGH